MLFFVGNIKGDFLFWMLDYFGDDFLEIGDFIVVDGNNFIVFVKICIFGS